MLVDCPESEEEQITREFQQGAYDFVPDVLEGFFWKHRCKILEFIRNSSNLPLEAAVEQWLVQHPYLDLRRENMAQVHEAELYRWYEGERGRVLSEEEAMAEWASKYRGTWRHHYGLAVAFVFEMNKERYLRIVRCGE